jgi:hypothetical protein
VKLVVLLKNIIVVSAIEVTWHIAQQIVQNHVLMVVVGYCVELRDVMNVVLENDIIVENVEIVIQHIDQQIVHIDSALFYSLYFYRVMVMYV